jgi:pimeloyl-ACP methyl ester carboxylesterase
MTAGYTVAIRRTRIDDLHAAAIAAAVSLLYLPVYVAFFENGLFRLPISDLVFQALYQGVLTAAISLALYGRAIHLLGASNAAAFVALQGLDDEAAPPGNGHVLREQFGERVRVIDLPRAGHFLLLEQPEAVTRAVAEFVGAGAVPC